MRVIVVVGQVKPAAKRGVVIAHAGQMEIVGVNVLDGDGRLLFATAQLAGGDSPYQNQSDALAAFQAGFLSGCSTTVRQSIIHKRRRIGR